MIDQLNMLREFHHTFRAHAEDEPTTDLAADVIALRVSLIQEELDEYRKAAEAGNLVEVADALSDLMYVVLGTYVAHGLHLHAEPLFEEVHRSNMSKLDEAGEPIFREDGKVLKSGRFEQPDLETILSQRLLNENPAGERPDGSSQGN